MAKVHLDAVVEYLESLLHRKITQEEKSTLLELIHFGRASKKKDGRFYSTPPG